MEKKSVKNKVIHSFSEVDLTAIAIPAIAIYKYPKDDTGDPVQAGTERI